MIYDMTQALQNPQIRWDSTLMEIEAHFEPQIRGVTQGVYVQYFENDHRLPVHDKNRTFASGGEGALVIDAYGASLKPGKFQGGFLRRRRQDADHLHRTREDPFGHTYRTCLKFALLLDLSEEAANAVLTVRRAEGLLKQKVDRILSDGDLLHPRATRRGDWRKLIDRGQERQLRDSMCSVLLELAQDLGIRS